ncbi:calcyphosin-like protein [Anneissia japonica]|uniref:calcyphosin-like protein n=1 Tax=Anneissia japonica TaxID=1529436 RepID=UPI00142578FF|nr:calcyphosin-like protein [Anneissia japonica]XP_033099183.1 calcyphosin-like protein [Anneissia japonica]
MAADQNPIQLIRSKLVEAGGRKGLMHAFRQMDRNKDFELSKKEFKTGLEKIGITSTVGDEAVERAFKLFDHDDSGKIDYSEFVDSLTLPLMSANRRKKVREIFGRLDKDGSEYCTEEDLRSMMNKDEIEQFLKEFDKQGEEDGKISLQEFAAYYCKIGEPMTDEEFHDRIQRDWPE